MRHLPHCILIGWILPLCGFADEGFQLSRCEVVPEPGHQVAFQIDGVEKTRWHFGPEYPRPFFYPLRGPSGAVLTRMGHPGASDHDHHRSIWFAHERVNGLNFWSDKARTTIRQKSWNACRDGDNESVMASNLGWYDENGREILEQETIVSLISLPAGNHELEFYLTLRPAAGNSSVELGQTNFGLLAVRMAKSISSYFGGGKLIDSEGRRGEKEIFGKRARWVDYRGPVAAYRERRETLEGITFFDHPDNIHYPTRWHVREDGWMGASLCMSESVTVTTDRPLVLRYLLHTHSGEYDQSEAEEVHKLFAARPGFVLEASTAKHRQFMVKRRSKTGKLRDFDSHASGVPAANKD